MSHGGADPPTLPHPLLPSHSTLPKSDPALEERRDAKRKSATLTPSSAHSPPATYTTSSSQSSNFRRSFTLPRSLTLRRPPSGPSNATTNDPNSGLTSLRSIFLSLLKGRRRKKDESTTHAVNPENGLPVGFLPAAVGLKNHGNTCFMNAILQCLSHTDLLAKYLVTDQYKTDLRKKYWIKNGKGEVTEELASILKSTWLRGSAPVVEEAAGKFKAVVERFNPQWRGSEQHDAHEFLIWLLNRLHEDLNLAPSTKFKLIKNNFGRPDEQIAAEWLANHVRCNNSIIEELFGAHFRSLLTCPGCGRTSASFDFFNMVSLPIPEPKQELPLYVNIIYLSQQPRQVKLGLSMSSSADVKELKHLLSLDTNIEQNLLILTEVDGEGFHRTFTELQPVSVLSRNEAVYCLETPPEETGEDTELGAFLLIIWTNLAVTSDSARVRFGSPYLTRVSRETCYADLQKILLKEMSPILTPGLLVQEQKEEAFVMRVLDGSTEGCVLEAGLEHPLYMEAVDQALALNDSDLPPHIKLHLEWTQENKERFIAEDSESVEEHSSVAETREKFVSEEPLSVVTLGECFDLYTKVEQLSPENSWHCSHCNRKEEGTLLTMGLWTAPNILVLHLKRFRQASKVRHSVTKISARVEFPVDGLDLAPHVTKRSKAGPIQDSMLSLNGGTSPMNGCFGSWKQRTSFKKHLTTQPTAPTDKRRRGFQPETPTCETRPMTYDLFAVCNHIGKDLQSGHYTAYCKNPVDKSWWSFDDTRVTELESADSINTPGAYMLFYQRRSPALAPVTTSHWCGSLVKKHAIINPPVAVPLPAKPTLDEAPPELNGHDERTPSSPPSPDLTIESTV